MIFWGGNCSITNEKLSLHYFTKEKGVKTYITNEKTYITSEKGVKTYITTNEKGGKTYFTNEKGGNSYFTNETGGNSYFTNEKGGTSPTKGPHYTHSTTTIITLLPTHILIEGIETFLAIPALTEDISFIHS
jgi:hypothetical protein